MIVSIGRKFDLLRQLLDRNSPNNSLVTELIGRTIDAPPEAIEIPEFSFIKRKLIIIQGKLSPRGRVIFPIFYNDIIFPKMPSIRRFAYFILRIMLGDIEQRLDWRDYFVKSITLDKK